MNPIRISIFAETQSRALNIADRLADDPRIEIVETRVLSATEDLPFLETADVIIVSGSETFALTEDLPVVFLSNWSHAVYTRQARAWLPANASSSEIVAAVIAVASNLTVLTPDQAWRWLPNVNTTSNISTTLIERLTDRELQVLRMLAIGLGNKEIAGQLGISDHTAKFHVAQILAKLNAGSRTEAVTIAIRRGLIPV